MGLFCNMTTDSNYQKGHISFKKNGNGLETSRTGHSTIVIYRQSNLS
jgi:hypothetical protein